MDNLKMEEFIQQIVTEESIPITLGVLKTNCIVNSKLLIEEIETGFRRRPVLCPTYMQ